ncbi:MAG: hypothetical protein K2R98_02270 [Gemmataceae bacterium]|nr:hypothetical protein [Gemmataceae bacterium]
MDPIQARQKNQAAYRTLKSTIDQSYPAGQFVAILEGSVVADASGIPELTAALTARGSNPKEALVIQAGVEYPEAAIIFAASYRR